MKLFKFLTVIFIIGIHTFLPAKDDDAVISENPEKQTVKGEKFYTIDTFWFKQPADACKKCKELYDKENNYSSLKLAEVTNNGAVRCVFKHKKSGEQDWDQQGLVMGKIVCPENATEEYIQGENIAFKDRKCECHTGYIAKINKCVLPEDTTAKEDTTAVAQATDSSCICKDDSKSIKLSSNLNKLAKILPFTNLPDTVKSKVTKLPIKDKNTGNDKLRYSDVVIKDIDKLILQKKVLVVSANDFPEITKIAAKLESSKENYDHASTGKISEDAFISYIKSIPCDSVFSEKTSGNNGLDVYTFFPCVEQPKTIRIFESKQVSSDGNIYLNGTDKGPQMSEEWILDKIMKMKNHKSNSEAKRHGESMQKNYTLIEKFVVAVHKGSLIIIKLASY